ncbi:hypothetical protein SEA_SONALI_14 [Arthrobacter phage Sonali]|uniref:Uncharacterized protein n=1 Tax=Arthrobacter phage Sonali TaxID=2510495 RepID=A0A411CQW1_9CAUD|nr:hypothetical protein HOV09_gp14 [Arthrobacter phage Sonali]QAY16212.1 hypothetical protein SEA_SONALI_14 [Arthrobacter phage Sonali]
MTVTHCTYQEYLDTPLPVIERVLRIHEVFKDADRKTELARTEAQIASSVPLIM